MLYQLGLSDKKTHRLEAVAFNADHGNLKKTCLQDLFTGVMIPEVQGDL